MRQLLSDSYAPGDMLHLDVAFCMIMLISEIGRFRRFRSGSKNTERDIPFIFLKEKTTVLGTVPTVPHF